MNEASVWNEIWTAGVATAKLLAQGTITAAVVAALSWFTVEWILPVAALFGFGRERQTDPVKRGAAFLFGQFMVLLAHGASVVDFGAGRQGWLAAWFFSFVGGGLAPMLHSRIKQRFPAVTNTATPAGPGGGS
jgi:hypothetical protein